MKKLRLGTRTSPLAVAQSEQVKQALLRTNPELDIELIGIMTEGDQRLEQPLYSIGGKGLFLKELDKALLDGVIDIAVHSVKDVPVDVTPGLMIAAMPERADPADAFVSNHFNSLAELPKGSKVGTCSLRRQCLVNQHFPELDVISLRGNINTRLARLDNGDFDAIILAVAGLNRLNFDERIRYALETDWMTPAVGQGALAVYCHENNAPLRELLAKINHTETRQAVDAERRVSKILDGGCHMPLAVHARVNGNLASLDAMIGMPDGTQFIHEATQTQTEHLMSAAEKVAIQLESKGAKDIINQLRGKW